MTTPPTPELDKRNAIIHSRVSPTLTLTDFIDWLESKQYHIGRYVKFDGYLDEVLVPVGIPPNQLFADFFGIDLEKCDKEQRALLEHLRSERA